MGIGLRGKKLFLGKKFEKLNIDRIKKNLNEIKLNIPDPLSTQESNQALFKINKYNELFNPLDASLQNEITSYNNYINNLTIKIDQINKIFKGEMICIDDYFNALFELNNGFIPKKWCVHYLENKNLTIEEWKVKIKKAFDDLNIWIQDAFLKEYDISLFNDSQLFLDILPFYFQKKLPENVFSTPDKILLKFFFTKFHHYNEIDEESLNKIKEYNNNKEIIFIKGLKVNNFEIVKDEDNVVFSESDFNFAEKSPLIGVTYIIDEMKEEEKKIEEEEEDEEEENEN